MDEIITWLLNYAFEHGIGVVTTTDLSPDIPSTAFAAERKILINLKWKNPAEIPFSIAHEIGHILNGDDGKFMLTSVAHSKAEHDANIVAFQILREWAESHDVDVSEPYLFMSCFAIPCKLSDQVAEEYARYDFKGGVAE